RTQGHRGRSRPARADRNSLRSVLDRGVAAGVRARLGAVVRRSPDLRRPPPGNGARFLLGSLGRAVRRRVRKTKERVNRSSSVAQETELGGYQLVGRLAVGGMAEVYQAKARSSTQKSPGEPDDVVLKRLLPAYRNDGGYVKAFVDEAKLTVRLRHAHIVR